MENVKAMLHAGAVDMLAWIEAGAPESNEFDFDAEFGLCTNLAYHPIIGEGRSGSWEARWAIEELLEECFQSWPHFTGSNAYPVPSPDPGQFGAGYAYVRNIKFPKYRGEYGAMRIDLLKHIIQCTA